MREIERVLYRAGTIGGWAGRGVLAGMVLLIVADVTLRYVFSRPIHASMEIVEFGLVLVVFCSIAFCTAQRSHLAIDTLVTRLPQRVQVVIGGIVHFIGAGIFGVIAWQSIVHAVRLEDYGNVTVLLNLPYYPFLSVVALCSLLVSLLLLGQLVRLITEAVRA